ncbi:MAG: hypothetical protein ACRD0Y_03780 [Terriglobales bacterium]
MPRDLDQLVEAVLAGYSRVEPAPGAVEGWVARRAEAPRHSAQRGSRFLWLPAPAWAAIAFALLVLLGLSWYSTGRIARQQPRLAGEGTSLRSLAPNTPLTAEQKKLIRILLTNPGALAAPKPVAKSPAGADHVH